MTRFPLALAVASASLLALSACQSDKRPANPGASGKSASLRVMEQVAIAAHKCWFASKDPAFSKYSMANELNNFGGTPRFLVVPKNNYGGKPLLVVQAQGQSSHVEAFGPMMEGPTGSRISSDINRWKAGDSSCGSAA
ncbi:MAG: hypothetical protein JNK47_20305 [Mesorhizobium sp.]|nr:hypothetical protein [Mesorhizobium sp.]MBL8579554.1 hypothetical protein [Mesorhizobium sp.]